jgi:hypothetical protein
MVPEVRLKPTNVRLTVAGERLPPITVISREVLIIRALTRSTEIVTLLIKVIPRV